MTVAEIVRKILPPGGTGHWTLDDYEKGWLVKHCITERKLIYQMSHIELPVTDAYGQACSDYRISPSDYTEIERRVREWEKDHG